jgi:hypothetical protein
MNVLPLIIYASELAIAALILWAVCNFLPMAAPARLIVQCLIVLVCVLAVLQAMISEVPPRLDPLLPPHPATPQNPSSIIK